LPFTLHTSHFTLHTSHFTLHTSHFTLHTSKSVTLGLRRPLLLWWSGAVFSAKVGNQLLNLVRVKRIAERRHLAFAVEDSVSNPIVGPMLLGADFRKSRTLFAAFKVGAVTAGAVVVK